MRSTSSVETAPIDEHVLVHQFIRLFGRRPSAAELERFRRGQVSPSPTVPGRGSARVRVRVAQLISRL